MKKSFRFNLFLYIFLLPLVSLFACQDNNEDGDDGVKPIDPPTNPPTEVEKDSIAYTEIRVAKYKGDRVCAISYTFDDGLLEHSTLVAPELEKRNFRGTFWIWGKCIENESEMQGAPRMNWAEMKKMANAGHEISNHSWSHVDLTKLKPAGMAREIALNDSVILEKIGIPSVSFCYPYNAYNSTLLQETTKNRVGTRTKQYTVGTASTAESLNEWVNGLIKNEDWGVTMTHGITYGYDAFKDQNVLWNHFDKVKAQEDKIWVATFREAAAYIEEQKNTRLDVARSRDRLTIKPSLSLDKNLFTEPLTLIVEGLNYADVKIEQGGKDLPAQMSGEKLVFDFDPSGGEILISAE